MVRLSGTIKMISRTHKEPIKPGRSSQDRLRRAANRNSEAPTPSSSPSSGGAAAARAKKFKIECGVGKRAALARTSGEGMRIERGRTRVGLTFGRSGLSRRAFGVGMVGTPYARLTSTWVRALRVQFPGHRLAEGSRVRRRRFRAAIIFVYFVDDASGGPISAEPRSVKLKLKTDGGPDCGFELCFLIKDLLIKLFFFYFLFLYLVVGCVL